MGCWLLRGARICIPASSWLGCGLNYVINFLYNICNYMSTLAAARADNFYYPKNYNPEKVPPKKSELTEDKPFKVV